MFTTVELHKADARAGTQCGRLLEVVGWCEKAFVAFTDSKARIRLIQCIAEPKEELGVYKPVSTSWMRTQVPVLAGEKLWMLHCCECEVS